MQGWKTLIFGMIVTALGAVTAADLIPYIGETWAGIGVAAIGVVIMALRAVTTTPIFKSD